MSNPFSAFCEDFYVNMRLGSQLTLPHSRETLLHLFERVQKTYPGMTRFRKTDSGEFNLEEDKSSQSYRWMSLEPKRISSGHVNPATIEESLKLHEMLLQMAPHHLGISPIEIDYLDVLFGFDLGFGGNHDEVIAESLFAESPLACLAEVVGHRAVDFQPTVTVALSDDCRLQARIDVVTRTNSYQVRTGDYSDDAISVYLVVRRYWGDRPKEPMEQIFTQLAAKAEQLCTDYIVPRAAPDLIGNRVAVLVGRFGSRVFTDRTDLLSIDGVKEAAAKDDLIADARRGASKAITLLEADEADLVRRASDPESLAKVRAALQATKAVRAALFSNPEPTDRP